MQSISSVLQSVDKLFDNVVAGIVGKIIEIYSIPNKIKNLVDDRDRRIAHLEQELAQSKKKIEENETEISNLIETLEESEREIRILIKEMNKNKKEDSVKMLIDLLNDEM